MHVQIYLYCRPTCVNHRHVEVQIQTVFVLRLEIRHETTIELEATAWQRPRQLIHVWNYLSTKISSAYTRLSRTFGGVESCLEFHAQELTHYQFFGTVRTCWNFDSCILRDSRHVKLLILLILVRN